VPSARVAEIVLGGTVEPWERLGIFFSGNAAVIGDVRLRCIPFLSPGIQSIGLVLPTDDDHQHDHEGTCDHDHGPTPSIIDGAPVHVCEPVDAVSGMGASLLAPRSIDHVVLMTNDLERTCGAAERATQAPLKRVREAPPVRQGFFRLGSVILEVVESPAVTHTGAKWWGLVVTVGDLHAACERLGGDVISAPKAAVQPGRFIATVRNEVGLGVPVALMTP